MKTNRILTGSLAFLMLFGVANVFSQDNAKPRPKSEPKAADAPQQSVKLAPGVAPEKPSAPTPPEKKIFPYPILQTKLDNGLNVVTVPYQSPGIAAFYIVVRTGSRNEVEPGHTGFAHFFEHMMFRGTDLYPKDKYGAVLKSTGASANA